MVSKVKPSSKQGNKNYPTSVNEAVADEPLLKLSREKYIKNEDQYLVMRFSLSAICDNTLWDVQCN